MLHILQRAGLQRARLFCTVHDNGANVVRACRLIEDRMYDHCCIAHNIQLCILDAIKVQFCPKCYGNVRQGAH